MLMIDTHRATIEGTALNISVFETLKASADVLRRMGATGHGLCAVEDVVSELEVCVTVCVLHILSCCTQTSVETQTKQA